MTRTEVMQIALFDLVVSSPYSFSGLTLTLVLRSRCRLVMKGNKMITGFVIFLVFIQYQV